MEGQLFGLEAISHYRGWAVAATGAIIVFSGLLILSLIISQLHKLVALLEKSPQSLEDAPAEATISKASSDPLDIGSLLSHYLPLLEALDTEFQLAELYRLAQEHQLPHPHLSIRRLREADKLVFLGNGFFRYQD